MDLFRLPILKLKNISQENNNTNIDDQKLCICNYQTKRNIDIIKTPLKLRKIISFTKSENKIDTPGLHTDRIKEIEKKNYEYGLIKQFLNQKLDYKYLKPIKVLPKSKSSDNINQDKYTSYFSKSRNDKGNIENKSGDKNNNYTFLLFKKFNKNLSNNLNKNQITNINKYLIKNNENETNGNFIYNDYNEEKKETFTFIINSKNSKELFKKKLTKKNNDNSNNKNCSNIILNNFKFDRKKYISPTEKNIRKIKYLQELIKQKNNNNKNLSNKNKLLKNIKNDKYNCFIRENIKNIDNKIDYTTRNLMNLDKLIKSCLDDSNKQFNLDSKNIFGEKFLK